MKFPALQKLHKVVGIFLLVVASWVLFVYVSDWPIVNQVTYSCPICRTSKTVMNYFMIPISIKVEDSEFSRYYKRYADPKHCHTWHFGGVSRMSRTSEISAHGGIRPGIPYEEAWAILQSLPKGQTQKAFFEKLPVVEQRSPEGLRVSKAVWKLNEAYWKNEHRKDWPEQLRKVGLYPDAISRK